jgi:hypothetical protein
MCHLSSLFVDVSASTVPQRFQTEETKKKKKMVRMPKKMF